MRTIFKKTIFYILQVESRLVLFKYKPKIVAITGSVGKTSTKDAMYRVLSQVAHVRKSEKSYNSEIGLPLSVLGLPNGWNNPLIWSKNFLKGIWLFVAPRKYPSWLILEVGVGKPGDMKRTASWLNTDIVVITGIGETPAHIEFFESREDLINEKSGLIDTLKHDGLLLLNADDPDVTEMGSKSKHKHLTYGFTKGADVEASGESIYYDDDGIPKGIQFRIDIAGDSLPVFIEGALGKNHTYASLATLALSHGLKLNILEAVNALRNYDAPPGRMRLLGGIKNTHIIDDTYNSSPYACEAAIRTLGEVKTRHRKVAILGDMLELGRHTEDAHEKMGGIVRESLRIRSDILVLVGLRAEAIGIGAIKAGFKEKNIFKFADAYEATEFVKNEIRDKDLLLVKGSQGMRMERIVEAILLDQDNKSTILVRQDPEWRAKK